MFALLNLLIHTKSTGLCSVLNAFSPKCTISWRAHSHQLLNSLFDPESAFVKTVKYSRCWWVKHLKSWGMWSVRWEKVQKKQIFHDKWGRWKDLLSPEALESGKGIGKEPWAPVVVLRGSARYAR
jgi:hypothetical protein